MPSKSALDNSIFKLQIPSFNLFFVVVFNILGSLHVLPHQLHGDHPQRVHLPHTHSGSVEASFETQLISERHMKTNIFEKVMSVPRYIMINDPLLAIDLTVSRCKKLLLLGYSESPILADSAQTAYCSTFPCVCVCVCVTGMTSQIFSII